MRGVGRVLGKFDDMDPCTTGAVVTAEREAAVVDVGKALSCRKAARWCCPFGIGVWTVDEDLPVDLLHVKRLRQVPPGRAVAAGDAGDTALVSEAPAVEGALDAIASNPSV